MKVDYDKHVDILSVVFSDSLVDESDEVRPGVILDFDANGRVVGMEILEASRLMDNPASVEFAVKAA